MTAIDKMSSIVWMATLVLVVIANLSEIKTHQMRKTTYCNYKPVLIQDEKHIDLHVLYFLSSKMAMKMKVSKRLIALHIIILLLTKCHYPEPNPGPRTPKFPCGACQKAVKTIDQGIM